MSIITILAGILLLVVSLATLWYFIKTLMILSKDNTLLAILGFFFSPIVQIIWYLSNKNRISPDDRKSFLRFFITYALMFLTSLIFVYLMFSVSYSVQTTSPIIQTM